MRSNLIFRYFLGLFIILGMTTAYAKLSIPIYLVSEKGQGKNIGRIYAEDTFHGVLFTPDLHDLPPGIHGFHIHIYPDCSNLGQAAGGHLDPQHSEQHRGPFAKRGHLGDLPTLVVDQDGTATLAMFAPRFHLSTISGHSLMIHAGADNYSDTPNKLGGGGARIACGVINS